MKPTLCVVVPTYNRVDTLVRCLKSLEAQTYKDFELLIVDDGSSDHTPEFVQRYMQGPSLPVRYLRQKNGGPARARNVALDHAGTDLTVLIGDDIFPAPDFVQQHLQFHLDNPGETFVAIGLTRWCEDGQRVTKFMRWLDTDGLQFGFGSLLAGRQPDWHDFYTSNISFKTRYLQAHHFDETFKYAAYEDLEMAYRLKRRHGLELRFLPNALAEHLHPTDFMRSCKRMQMVGKSAFTFKQLWPEFQEYPPLTTSRRKLFNFVSQPALLSLLSRAASALTSVWCPNPFAKRVLEIHGRVGYVQAEQDHGGSYQTAA